MTITVITPPRDSVQDLNLTDIVSTFATVINFIAASAIGIRIKQFQRKLKADGLGPSSPYTAYMEIWIESAVLIVSFGIVYIVLAVFLQNPVSFIFMECLIPINVRVHNFLLGCKNLTGNLTFA